MAAFDNLVAVLRAWPLWKRIEQAPERVDALEARIAALETKLRRAPGEACPRCGELDFRTESSEPDHVTGPMGGIRRTMKCGACSFSEVKLVVPE